MTITDDTAAKLREAAEKATPGPWKHVTYMSGTQNVEYPGSKGITFSDQVIAADASAICYESDAQPLPFINISHRHEDKGSEVDPQRSLNAAYIALSNPQTVLALLDHLAAEKARADAAEAERDHEAIVKREAVAGWRAAEATISTLTAERDAEAEGRKTSTAIVDRIWDIFGRPSYEELSGRTIYDLITDLKRERDEAREALKPFAAVAEHDIGEDETENDVFRPMNAHNRAPLLTVGHLRRARAVLARTGEPKDG